MPDITSEIEQLKNDKKAVILAHYYVNDEVQAVADYVGDSYYLSKIAKDCEKQVIIFCGVSFMGESAKILSPEKTVVMPDVSADCPMAHMVDIDNIDKVRASYEDIAVVCYINSTALIKSHSDVCVTSSNAVKVVNSLPEHNIYFIPDNNLGRYVASQIPDKNFIFNDGFCHVHTSISKDNVLKAKTASPTAEILVHPECNEDVIKLADYVGSTSGIINYATNSKSHYFIICTEMGILYELQKKNPDKKFYSVGHRQFCPNMKRITLEKVKSALQTLKPEIDVNEKLMEQALIPLNKMLDLSI
ncbi:MAG: quinolinate synthase NadA [Anaerocolumna sp.]